MGFENGGLLRVWRTVEFESALAVAQIIASASRFTPWAPALARGVGALRIKGFRTGGALKIVGLERWLWV